MTLDLDAALTMRTTLNIWLPQDVAERLGEAVTTLRRLPMPRDGMPAGYGSTMPMPLVSFWEMWNQLTAAEREERRNDFNCTRIPPTGDQIREMDEALTWLLWLDERDRKVIMAKAGGASYRKITYFDGRNREHLRRVWRQGIDTIAKNLNAHGS